MVPGSRPDTVILGFAEVPKYTGCCPASFHDRSPVGSSPSTGTVNEFVSLIKME